MDAPGTGAPGGGTGSRGAPEGPPTGAPRGVRGAAAPSSTRDAAAPSSTRDAAAPSSTRDAAAPSSIRDVAVAAGVSVATVSRALRGLDRVSEATRARVLRAAEALDYVASPTAASLATGRTSVVAVVLPFLDRWFFSTIVSEVEDVLRRRGYQVLLVNVGDRSGQETLVLDQRLLAKRIDAVIVLGVDLEPAEAAVLRRLALPVVTISSTLAGCDRVGIDDVAAAETATRHLLSLGHRRIGYVGGDSGRDVRRATAVDRARGAHQALAAAGLEPAPELEVVTDWTVTGGWRAGEALLSQRHPPTAVVAASDEMAIGVLCAARAAGRQVPRELSVVGIDDHEMSVTHQLTTVAQPVRSQGRIAAEMLLARLSPRGGTAAGTAGTAGGSAAGTAAGPGAGGPRDVVLSTALVVRASAAAPPRPRRGQARAGPGAGGGVDAGGASPQDGERAGSGRRR
ncbi:hypothetical protein NUM3379_02650 [Kineococcus sp. NUM-3379]